MKNKIEKAKQDVMWGVKMMVERGYSLGTAGNISARVEGEDLFVITPSSRPYNTLELNDLCLIDMKGNIVDAKFKPSVEATMHIENIKELPIIDVESISYLGGEVPIAPFAPAGSLELATSVKNSIGTSAGVLMENHGTIGVGITMEKALIASDNIERTSEQFLFLLATGLRKKEIPNDYVNKVREISKVNRKISTK